MEDNASQALYMAFGVMMLVIALTVAISIFSLARQTSDIVIQTADETSYYDYETYSKNGTAGENRIVGMETVIPTLYKYIQENYSVIFLDGTSGYDYNTNATAISNLKPLTIYQTKTKSTTWSTQYTGQTGVNGNDNIAPSIGYTLSKKSGSEQNISVFDIDEESYRNESWRINNETTKKNITAILNGDTSFNNNNSYASASNPLTKKNSKFVEFVGREKIVKKNATTGTNQTTTKAYITYVLIKND